MIKFRLAHLGLAMAALGFTAAAPIVGLAPAHAQTVSAQVGKPLQAAQALMKQGKHKDAVAVLEPLVQNTKNPDQARQAKEMLERIQALLKK